MLKIGADADRHRTDGVGAASASGWRGEDAFVFSDRSGDQVFAGLPEDGREIRAEGAAARVQAGHPLSAETAACAEADSQPRALSLIDFASDDFIFV